ncbi:MAG: hypothetical protein BroJett038_33150 [Chloroflexota bacterium]|nr:MAG: hypothetical protein BroJett038_33150 [Chloroflexota bacterium]
MMVLITGHRRESFGAGFKNICNAIVRLAEKHPHVHFVYPVHLNPQVRKPVYAILGRAASIEGFNNNIHLIEPQSYLEFVALMESSDIILTDSGGVQEEAPTLGKPVLVMRETTEREEAIATGAVRLVGTNTEQIFRECNRLLINANARKRMGAVENPYGDGKATPRIIEACRNFLKKR